MKTLVTGASGFIGSAVVRRLLSRGREVRVLIDPGFRPRVDLLAGLDVERVPGDVRDREAIGRALKGCSRLYHLAAIYADWTPTPERIYDVNVEGGKTVLFAAYRASLERVVYTSSIAAVGRRPDLPPDETCEFSRTDWREGNAYIRSKWLSERDALRFAAEGLPLVVVNPAFPFGPGDVAPTPTGRFVLSVLNQEATAWFPGGFNAVDVDDLAEGHVLAEERGRIGERYILGGHNVDYQDFFALVAELSGMPGPKFRLPPLVTLGLGWLMETYADQVSRKQPLFTYKGGRLMTRRLFFDCTKARRELGLATTPLRSTLERSIEWFRRHGYA